ncbi:unnamed protein product [Caenorhabditis angaria]|uniref:Major facilitator superfamily (MFS) profile domain-containing protein n=1 Tax=Caenorhabditis angaria TaxID=860376 RepID=A0A9P1IY24_9PELO|nr:unnamed protein product [Caenorhabditis angaria]
MESQKEVQYIAYKERWLILSVCCLLALSNATQWMSLMAIAGQVNTYYRGGSQDSTTVYDVAFIENQIFQLVCFFTGFAGMWITDNWGVKVSCLMGTTINLIGASVRFGASFPQIKNMIVRETALHIGSFIAALSQGFFLVLPSKIAECWFPQDQRAIANVLSFVANPAGVALGTIIPSLIFSPTLDKDSNLPGFYTFGMLLLALLPFILALFIRRKLPPTPPSVSASKADHKCETGFIGSIIECLTTFQFVILLINFSLAFSVLWSLMISLEEPLISRKYQLQGYPTAVAAIIGTISSLIAGHVADKTQAFKEIIRCCAFGFALSVITLRLWIEKERNFGVMDDVVVLVLCGFCGAFSIPQFPIGVELGVEATFPILEATSSGVLVVFGSGFLVLIPILQNTLKKYPILYEENWKFPLDVLCGLAVFAFILSVTLLRPTYRRLELEHTKIASPETTQSSISVTEKRDDSEKLE